MRRFRFPLETLLSVRRHRRQAAEMKLAEIERTRREVEEERIKVEQELDRVYAEEREREAARALDVEALRRASQYVRYLSARGQATDLHLAKLDRKKEAARQELVEANRNQRLLENVRERRAGEWRVESEREEQAFLDELGLGGFRRERGAILGKLLGLIVVVALIGAGVYGYRKGYFEKDYFKRAEAFKTRDDAPLTLPPAGRTAGSGPASATREAAGAADVVFDPTEEVYFFSTELGKNLRISETLKELEAERARLRERQAALDRLEQDLRRRETEVVGREDEVEKKWQEAVAALEENRQIVLERESEEARARREMIARLAKNIGNARPASGAELIQHVDETILPEVLAQIADTKLSKLLEQLAVQSAEVASASARLNLILRIMGKVEESPEGGSRT